MGPIGINDGNVGRVAERIVSNELEFRGFRVSDLNTDGTSANADLEAMTPDEKRKQYNALPSATRKKMAEMRAFKGFVDATKVAVDSGSEKNEEPPFDGSFCALFLLPPSR